MILVDSQKRVCYDSIKALENGHSSCQEFTFSPESIEMKSYLVLCSLILGLFLASAGQTLADKDLVLYFPFDQQGGQKAIDRSLRGNNGAIENGKWVAGKFGNALEFDGSKSRLEIASSDSLNPKKELSVAMWFKAKGQLPAAEGARFMDKWGQGGKNADKNSGYVVAFFPGAHENRLVLHYNMNDFAGKGFILPFDGKWHHIAVVLDSTVKGVKAIQMYLDGNAEEVVKWFLPAPAGVPLTPNDVKLKIGCGNNAWNYFKGSLDDVVMFSRALSENEVKDLASSPYSVTPAGKLSVSWGFIKKSY